MGCHSNRRPAPFTVSSNPFFQASHNWPRAPRLRPLRTESPVQKCSTPKNFPFTRTTSPCFAGRSAFRNFTFTHIRTSMDQIAHDRLTVLADTYKKQQFKLTKSEIEEAAELLAQVLAASLGPAHDTADAFIRALPADSTTKAIGDSWLQLPDAVKQHLLKN